MNISIIHSMAPEQQECTHPIETLLRLSHRTTQAHPAKRIRSESSDSIAPSMPQPYIPLPHAQALPIVEHPYNSDHPQLALMLRGYFNEHNQFHQSAIITALNDYSKTTRGDDLSKFLAWVSIAEDPHISDVQYGRTPLSWAVILLNNSQTISSIIVSLLTRYPSSFKINHQDAHGRTALHYAVIAGAGNRQELCQILINHGASAGITDKNGETPLSLAAKNGAVTLVHLLLMHIHNRQTIWHAITAARKSRDEYRSIGATGLAFDTIIGSLNDEYRATDSSDDDN